MPDPTPQQQLAIRATGDVLVMAGAGAGKTSTLVGRILDRLLHATPRVPIDRLLVVTFTEAAAAEMRHRLQMALENRLFENPGDTWLAEQLAMLDAAHVSTLHAFCLRLIRDHFHELGLDPQFTVQDSMHAAVMRRQVLSDLLSDHYRAEGPDPMGVRAFLRRHAADDDAGVSALILSVHDHARSLPEPEAWFESQRRAHSSSEPVAWREALEVGVAHWAHGWIEDAVRLERAQPENHAPSEVLRPLRTLAARIPPGDSADETRARILEGLNAIINAGERSRFRHGKVGLWRKPLEDLFDEAAALRDYLEPSRPGGMDPLLEDWTWARPDVLAMLELVAEFDRRFTAARRSSAVVDFADLEQLALRLLWNSETQSPTDLARQWQARIELVFVDEYQDINGAQDRIITSLSRNGSAANRFFVGDIKQSIYRFRRANPRIFQGYARDWRDGPHGSVIPLPENFRSHEALLGFVNELFGHLMRLDLGGVVYDAEARLIFGAPDQRTALRADAQGRVELLLCLKTNEGNERVPEETDGGPGGEEDLDAEESQARMVAARFRELHEAGERIWDPVERCLRPVAWRDMVVLHPAPRPVAERWARQFGRAGIPMEAHRGGFFDALEVSDILHLTRLLDNPRQDLPLLAVLRSPLVGMTVDELAVLRIARRGIPLWEAFESFLRRRPSEASPPRTPSSTDDPAMEPLRDRDRRALADPALQDIVRSAEEKGRLFRSRFDRWRRIAREGSLVTCLERVLADTGYDGWLRAQPRAEARLANLRKLLALSAEFDQFHRHGLFRFLQFIEAQADAALNVESAPAAATDCVRLMSVHQSKGLEFPVVAVAGLGRGFNLRDLYGDWLIDEDYGICPPVIPPGRLRGYHSLVRWLAEPAHKRELVGEQLRLLYVACTRAADRLFLVGTARDSAANRWSDPAHTFTLRDLARATTSLAYLGPLIPQLTGTTDWLAMESGVGPWMAWRVQNEELGRDEEVESTVPSDVRPEDPRAMDAVRAKLSWEYPWPMATREPAKSAVTRLTRTWRADELASISTFGRREQQGRRGSAGIPGAVERGLAYHRFMEWVNIESTGSRSELMSEIGRLERLNHMTPDEIALLDPESLWAFWSSELGDALRQRKDQVQRELIFTVRLRAVEAAGFRERDFLPGYSENDFQVIQGVVDLAVIAPNEIWIVDYKTDRVDRADVEAHADGYRFQIRLYAHALRSIYRRPVTQSWLYFIQPRQLLPMPSDDEPAGRGTR